MALIFGRSTFCKIGAIPALLGKQTLAKGHGPMVAVCQIQVAGMKATYGDPYPYAKPWPYKTRKYTLLHEFFDSTSARFNENSKVIVVDGNLAVGKKEFAQRLAKDFDLKYYPPVTDDDLFIEEENGFDRRSLNEMLPERLHFYDLAKFYSDPSPKSGKVGWLQLLFYMQKYRRYASALQHLFSTGQGVVVVSSVYSDHAYIETFRKLGFVTPNFYKYYYDLRDNSICEMLKPHISIFLDAPTNVIMDRMKRRNDEREMKGKFMNEKYVETLNWAFREKVIPRLRTSGEMMEIDWTEVADEMDMDVIVEEIQRLNLECEDNEDVRFHDWYKLSEDMMCHYRKVFGSKRQVNDQITRAIPWECPEVLPHADDMDIIYRVVFDHPALKYDPGYAPQLGHNVLFKL